MAIFSISGTLSLHTSSQRYYAAVSRPQVPAGREAPQSENIAMDPSPFVAVSAEKPRIYSQKYKYAKAQGMSVIY